MRFLLLLVQIEPLFIKKNSIMHVFKTQHAKMHDRKSKSNSGLLVDVCGVGLNSAVAPSKRITRVEAGERRLGDLRRCFHGAEAASLGERQGGLDDLD